MYIYIYIYCKKKTIFESYTDRVPNTIVEQIRIR